MNLCSRIAWRHPCRIVAVRARGIDVLFGASHSKSYATQEADKPKLASDGFPLNFDHLTSLPETIKGVFRTPVPTQKPYDRDEVDFIPATFKQADGSFQIFNHPMVLTTSVSFLSQWMYNNRQRRKYVSHVERKFSDKRLLACANQIYLILAKAFYTNDFAETQLLLEPMINNRLEKVASLFSDSERALFQLSEDDLFHSFIYLIDRRSISAESGSGTMFHFHTCAYFVRGLRQLTDENGGKQPSLAYLRRKHRERIIIGNITLTRSCHWGKAQGTYDPDTPQPWMVTLFNFFQHPSRVKLYV